MTPTHAKQFENHWLLWFSESNRYSVVSNSIKLLLDIFTKARNYTEFYQNIKQLLGFKGVNVKALYADINNYLNECYKRSDNFHEYSNPLSYDNTKALCNAIYNVNGIHIKLHYDIASNHSLLHYHLAHFQVSNEVHHSYPIQFTVYTNEGYIYLYKKGKLLTCVNPKNVHFLQGKFVMHLLCSLYDTSEEDWIATLHASTVVKQQKALMLIGNSGSGKSTLTSILGANGFDVLSDDLTPLRETPLKLFYNPCSISIKQGAFEVLPLYYDNFNSLDSVVLNSFKGKIKHLPFKAPENNSYNCRHILLVNYVINSVTSLSKITIDEALEVLIPESWLSHKEEHAKLFMDWLSMQAFYKLTYSNNDEAIEALADILD